jgi:hypothetical protein
MQLQCLVVVTAQPQLANLLLAVHKPNKNQKVRRKLIANKCCTLGALDLIAEKQGSHC